ncbi:hypothetical protein D3C78_1170830 [compost metagenome]
MNRQLKFVAGIAKTQAHQAPCLDQRRHPGQWQIAPAKACFDHLHGEVEAVGGPVRGADQRARVGQRQVAAAHQDLAHVDQVFQVADAPVAQCRVRR